MSQVASDEVVDRREVGELLVDGLETYIGGLLLKA